MATETSTPTMFSPPELAARWRKSADDIRRMIELGYITAINLAVNPNGRPRWRIHISEVEKFERERASKPPATTVRRRRRATATATKEYF